MHKVQKVFVGLQNVLEDIQMGRLQVLILPWDLHAKVYKCKDEMIFANPEEAAGAWFILW